jgi:hypothetical protein
MPQEYGRRLPLSPARRFITDLASFAMRVPLCTLERTMRLGMLVEARREVQRAPGWCSLFTKAYAIVAARRPELRQAYIPWPWPHLYEHTLNIASVAIERRIGMENAVLFAHIRAPENQSLSRIEAYLRRCKEAPIESIALFRRALKMGRWPWPARWLLWWYAMNLSGFRRSRYLGTFGVSAVAHLGACSVHLLTPVATALNYGPLERDGSLLVRLTYDHRILDGCDAARTLAEVEEALCGELLEEVRGPSDLTDLAWKEGPGAREWQPLGDEEESAEEEEANLNLFWSEIE